MLVLDTNNKSSQLTSKNVLVSIVAPVYNVADYLSAFINSVIRQTYSRWELILVDDGSTDLSGQICDEYAQGDIRIKTYHKPNAGVSSARNMGLKEMKGEWVLMPDPDDELPEDALVTLVSCVSDDIDLISSSYVWFKNGELTAPSSQSYEMTLSRDEYVKMIGILPQPRNLHRRCCNKMFRSSVIIDNSVYFPEDLHYREDILYNYQFLSYSKKSIKCLSYDMYIYYMRNTGAAISLQDCYSPKSGGKFIAMTRCYDILECMGVSVEIKERMKKEILKSYRDVIRLITNSGVGKEEKASYKQKLLHYFSYKELLIISLNTVYKRFRNRILKGIKYVFKGKLFGFFRAVFLGSGKCLIII